MFAFALSPLSPSPIIPPCPIPPYLNHQPLHHPHTPLNPHPNAHHPILQRPEIALWLHGVPIYGHTHPGACVGVPPTPLSFGSLPTLSRSQIVRNAAFFAVFSHFLRHSRKIFTNFRHLATASQRPTRVTPYKRDLPLFPRSIFPLAFFNVGTRHRSLIDDFPIKGYCLMVNRMTECVIIGDEKSHSMLLCNAYE